MLQKHEEFWLNMPVIPLGIILPDAGANLIKMVYEISLGLVVLQI